MWGTAQLCFLLAGLYAIFYLMYLSGLLHGAQARQARALGSASRERRRRRRRTRRPPRLSPSLYLSTEQTLLCTTYVNTWISLRRPVRQVDRLRPGSVLH